MRQRILAVDDEEIIRNAFRSVLENYEIETVESGEAALRILPEYRPDLILLDIMMPEMDGYEVCEKIRDDQVFQFVKILMVSARNNIADRLKGYQAGADDYVSKPFDNKELIAKIDVFLRLKHEEETNKIQQNFFKLISHETRTPLNIIMGFTQVLLNVDSLDNTTRRYIGFIQNAGNGLIKRVEQMQLFLKLRNNPKLDLEESDIIDVIKNVVNQYMENAKNVKFVLNGIEKKLVSVNVRLINNALKNIIDNALKASPDYGQVVISTEVNDAKYIIKIRDEGEGIKQRPIEKIFNVFSNDDIMHHQEGLGVNLAITKSILNLHGGNVLAENQAKGGALFTLELKL